MELCISCKNQKTSDRCNRKCIKGLDVCGTHAKAKTRRNWYDINNIHAKLCKIQAVWKGYSTRSILKRAGPGVLKRSICHNEEELVSFEPISKLHPFSYFSFEEQGKIWAFDTHSIAKILLQSVYPQNPYTRTPLNFETRRRLRECFHYLMRHKDREMVHIAQGYIVEYRLNLLTQIIHENGFEDFRSEYISILSKEQSFVMRSLLVYDIRGLISKNPSGRHHRYCSLLTSRTFMISSHPTIALLTMLLLILTDIRNTSEEYEICFLIMSTLYRI